MTTMSPATMSPAVSRRDRKKHESRHAMQRAALQLTLERGLHAVTVEAIADAADVSVRTFFNYFSSKEEAIVGYDPDRPAQLRAALAARPVGEEPLASLHAVLVEMAEQMVDRHEEWEQRLAAIKAHPELLAAHLAAWSVLERSLVEAVAERTGTDAERDLYPALVVAAAVGANRAAVLRWRAGASRRATALLPALVGEALDALADGLRAPPPRGTRRTRITGGG